VTRPAPVVSRDPAHDGYGLLVGDASSQTGESARAGVRDASTSPVAMSCLVTSSPRTGSWLLARSLAATGVAGRPAECFQPMAYQRYARARSRPVPVGEYFDHCVAEGTTDNGVLGTILKWNGFRWLLALRRALAPTPTPVPADAESADGLFPHPRYVHLYREDTARQAISWYRASRTEVWHHHAGVPAGPDKLDGIEPDYVRIGWLEGLAREHNRRWQDYFACHEITPLVISYEQLEDDLPVATRRVLDFLEVDVPPDFSDYRSDVVRQSDHTTERWLQTYLARRDGLPASPWAPVRGSGAPSTP
jgi:LPS sulfotransferase NodH